MSAISFKVTRNDISPTLSKMASAARRPEPVFRAMGTTFMSITMGNFKAANASLRPTPWPAKKDGSVATLRSSFEDRTLRIPDDPAIVADLRAIKKETTASGNIRFTADRGKNGHADRFWALALAKHAAGKSEGGLLTMTGVAVGGNKMSGIVAPGMGSRFAK